MNDTSPEMAQMFADAYARFSGEQRMEIAAQNAYADYVDSELNFIKK